MSKKNTQDISSMLGTADLSAKVPRPQTQAQAQEPVNAPAVAAKRVTITLNPDVHRRMKVMTAEQGERLQTRIDEILDEYLKTHNR